MKLRKKLIIFSILFLFGFGVFFGTFARGGYLVKAEQFERYTLGYGEFTDTTNAGDDFDVYYDLTYDDDGKTYTFSVIYNNNVYDFITEDYFIDANFNALPLINNDNENGMANADARIQLDIIEISEANFGQSVEFDIMLDADLQEKIGYIEIYCLIDSVYLDAGGVGFADLCDIELILTCYSFQLATDLYDAGYNYAYDIAYDLGHDDGYTEGHDDGYDEGYTIGETAGYNDGLDIGYYNGYEVGHYDGYTEGDAAGYSRGLDEGYDIGLDEGIQLSGYKEAYEAGIAKAENTATTWFKGIFNGLQGFLNIEIMGISIGTIILIPVAISFVWFIIRQFRGGGGGD